MDDPRYKCALCGADLDSDYESCPHCGCPEVNEVEEEYLSDEDVFGLLDDGVIPNV